MKTTTQPISVLLVEDDPAHAEIVLRNLDALASHVRCIAHVRDGQEALDYLQHEGEHQSQDHAPLPDLVLLDLRLPRVDGFEVLKRMKASSDVNHIPVVVLTTSEAESDIVAAYRGGASSYLVKPAEFEAYIRLLQGFDRYWGELSRVHRA